MNTKKIITIITLSIIFILQLFITVYAQENVNTQTNNTGTLTLQEIEKLSDNHTAGTAGPKQFKERLTKTYYNQQNWSYGWGWNIFFFIIAVVGFISALMSRYSNIKQYTAPIVLGTEAILLISSIFIIPNFLSIVFGFKGFLLTLAYILIPILIIISFCNLKENGEVSLLIMFILSIFSLSFIMPNVIYMLAEQTKWGTMYWLFLIASSIFFVELTESISNSTEANESSQLLALEQKNSYLLSAKTDLENQLSRYRQIEQKSNEFQNRIQTLENDKKNLNIQIQQLSLDNKEKDDKINKSDKLLATLTNENKDLQNKLKILRTDLITTSNKQQAIIDEKTKEIGDLKEQKDNLQKGKDELTKETFKLNHIINSLNDIIDSLQETKIDTIDDESIKRLKSSEMGMITETSLKIPFIYTYNNNKYRIIGISHSAFKNWNKLENVNFDDNSPITCIPISAFEGCTSLNKITLPLSIVKIENSAFKNCTELKQIDIPSRVSIIEKDAFKDCTSLEKITLHENISTIEESAFENCDKISEINISGVKNIKQSTFKGCQNLEKVLLSKSLESIEEYAFAGCTNLKEIKIPNSVKTIKQFAFKDCASIEKIEIPNGVKTIENNAFKGCNNLTQITLPKSLESIEDNAFEGCTNLNEIEIPNGLKTIGKSAFENCNNLKEIYIPKTVTSIGKDAFNSTDAYIYYNGEAKGKCWGAYECESWKDEEEYWKNKEEEAKSKSNKEEDIGIKFICPQCGYNSEEEAHRPRKKVRLKKDLPEKESKENDIQEKGNNENKTIEKLSQLKQLMSKQNIQEKDNKENTTIEKLSQLKQLMSKQDIQEKENKENKTIEKLSQLKQLMSERENIDII